MKTCSIRLGAPRSAACQRLASPALQRPAFRAVRSRRSCRPAANATAERGASGLDIGGSRPTSPKAWEAMSAALKQSGVKFISPQEVANVQARGTPVVDIRPEPDFKKGRIPGSINVQLYQLIAGWSARQVARRLNFALFGVLNGTEVNPNFMEQMEAAVPNKSQGVILVCNIGGSLDEYGPSKFGRQSRSLISAYELVQAGYKNVQVLKGGYADWAKNERPVEFDE